MKTKLISLLLAAAMMLSVTATGCNSDSEDSSSVRETDASISQVQESEPESSAHGRRKVRPRK